MNKLSLSIYSKELKKKYYKCYCHYLIIDFIFLRVFTFNKSISKIIIHELTNKS